MKQQHTPPSTVDPSLLWAWVAARSIARGVPMPVPDWGGVRVDTALPGETHRYVFAEPSPCIARLARTIAEPNILIKLCGTGAQLLALLPPGWQLQPAGYLMVHEGACADTAPRLPDGYRLELHRHGLAAMVRILARDGSLAARGYAAHCDGVFIVDRIATEAAHQRRGLGRALMAALGSTQPPSTRRVLVATDEGRHLYTSLGWTVLSPYATAASPGSAP